ncbi:MAG: NADH-quinone oxidoreductase subunit N [Porphyromonadaceae bacterium]|nr:NADH-quinone oxidoreductase subunit N [Porphyromonadaceae bacterium]
MDFSNFLWMRDEMSLLGVILVLFLYDTFGTEKSRRAFSWVACLLLAVQTAYLFCPSRMGSSFGGMYYTTPMGDAVKAILNIGTLLVFLQADAWAKKPDMVIRRGEFYVLTLMTLLGMYLMISAGNFLLFFIGLEMASLPLTALVAIEKYHQLSYEAAAKYVFVALFSSSLLLLGLSFVYGAVGTLYFADIAAQLTGNPLLYVGLVFFMAGMGFKISIVPFHLWTADVYQSAPTPVTAYLSVISKGAAAFALMIVLFKVFSPIPVIWRPVLWGLIFITITVGNLFAVRQKNLKRFMAFSSISQAGYILLGVLAGSAVGMASLVYYVLVYVFSNLAVFGVISVIENATGKVGMDDYNGLYRTNPKLSVAMMLALFSLAGIPPFAGFFSKFFIFYAAVSEGFYVLVFLALLNTIISLYYYLLVVKAMFIRQDDCIIPPLRSDGASRLSLSICVLGIIATGLLSCIYSSLNGLAFGF